jgi:SAM-dependent methyltransferase
MDAAVDYLRYKKTTQNAFLERPLSILRSRKVKKYCRDQAVLDFGCGAGLLNLIALRDVASSLSGFDQLFLNQKTWLSPEGFTLFGSYDCIPNNAFDIITSLAVFEHIQPDELPEVLNRLKSKLKVGGKIVGTVPTPLGKPVLEFVSFRLKLIDESQIRDHKVYYDQVSLESQVKKSGLKLGYYEKFQFGMNSFFVLEMID